MVNRIKQQPATWSAVALAVLALGERVYDRAIEDKPQHQQAVATLGVQVDQVRQDIDRVGKARASSGEAFRELSERVAALEAVLELLTTGKVKLARETVAGLPELRVEIPAEVSAAPAMSPGPDVVQRKLEELYGAP